MVKEDFERQLLRTHLDQKGKVRLGRCLGSYAWVIVVDVSLVFLGGDQWLYIVKWENALQIHIFQHSSNISTLSKVKLDNEEDR